MMRGRYYEDFEVGDHYQHPVGRTISEADNTWFTLLNQDGDECVSWTRTFMVYKRDAPHDKNYFPDANKEP